MAGRADSGRDQIFRPAPRRGGSVHVGTCGPLWPSHAQVEKAAAMEAKLAATRTGSVTLPPATPAPPTLVPVAVPPAAKVEQAAVAARGPSSRAASMPSAAPTLPAPTAASQITMGAAATGPFS